jgi:predicted RNase H-like nuclease
MAGRPEGSKYHYRLADRRSGSSSAMRLFRVPVGKMFYRGAPLLLSADVSVEPCRPTGSGRVALEAYPAVVARRFLGRRSYKSDERKKQTPVQRAAREELIAGLESATLREAYGFVVKMDEAWREELVQEPMADTLDSLLCAVQAAWAYTQRDEGWGVPEECDRDEGWILDPQLLEERG